MIQEPTEQQRHEFLEKVLPIVFDMVERENFKARKAGGEISRGLNLALGLVARTKAERAFQAALLTEIARQHPGSEYPSACPPAPQTERPVLRVV